MSNAPSVEVEELSPAALAVLDAASRAERAALAARQCVLDAEGSAIDAKQSAALADGAALRAIAFGTAAIVAVYLGMKLLERVIAKLENGE